MVAYRDKVYTRYTYIEGLKLHNTYTCYCFRGMNTTAHSFIGRESQMSSFKKNRHAQH